MNKATRRKLEAAGIVAPTHKLSGEQLEAQLALARRAGPVPNRKRVTARRAARGGTTRWAREQ